MLETADVVIVGAGAAGCLMAAELAQAKMRVVVLEAGPPWTVADLWSSQLWARRLKWRGSAVELHGANPIAHNLIMGSGFGGAALHHYGTWPRFPADVFDVGTRYGRGVNWPITYDTLRPYYDQVQSTVGLSGDAAQETWRPPGDPYPMPPLRSFRHGEVLGAGFRKLRLEIAPLPAAINSVPYRGRAACLYDGWCDAGCPIGALGNPLFTYQPQATARGARFKSGCRVTRVLADSSGRALGVEYVEHGMSKSLHAGVVILAASVVENPRILLNSRTEVHPAGLGNSSGLLGRHVMAEIMAFSYGLFAGPMDNHMGVSAGQFMHRGPVANPAVAGAICGHQWQIGPALKPNDIFGIAVTRPGLYGRELDQFIREACKDLAYMVGFGGGLPDPANRISLSAVRDEFGVPLAQVTHRFTDEQQRLWRFMSDEGQQVVSAAGARESWGGPMGAGHLIGGTIMGSDAAKSVTNGYGGLHDASNVFVAGAGLFPFSGGGSPTFTLQALALRTSHHLTGHRAAAS